MTLTELFLSLKGDETLTVNKGLAMIAVEKDCCSGSCHRCPHVVRKYVSTAEFKYARCDIAGITVENILNELRGTNG